jgi:hypothetical protein
MLRYQRGYVSLHLQMQKSVSVCYPGEMKRRMKTISRAQNLLLVEDLEFTTEPGLQVFEVLLRTGVEVW